MRRMQTGGKLLRLLVLAAFFSMALAGCGTSRYEAVDLTGSESTQAASEGESGGTAGENGDDGDEKAGTMGAETDLEESGEARVALTIGADGTIMVHESGETAEAEAPSVESGDSDSNDAEPAAAAGAEAASFNGHIVALDAGRQAKANSAREPIGPGSETMKARMSEGAVGVVTGVEEYELTLTVARKLETELTERGYQVVMIRNSHDVNLSNAERSEIANESGADILIRLYANSMDNSGLYGALTACMTEQNPYNAELHDKSYSLSKRIVDRICAQTGTKNRGVQEVDNNGAINWSKIPVSVVEMGFLSNPDEDRWLQDENYQNRLAAGIAEAVDAYFAEGN